MYIFSIIIEFITQNHSVFTSLLNQISCDLLISMNTHIKPFLLMEKMIDLETLGVVIYIRYYCVLKILYAWHGIPTANRKIWISDSDHTHYSLHPDISLNSSIISDEYVNLKNNSDQTILLCQYSLFELIELLFFRNLKFFNEYFFW